jgi:transposase InsO family protein
MIDPATGWFEMREIPTKKSDVVANVLEQAWLTRYPWPTQMIFDRGSEFKAAMTQMLKSDYGIKIKAVTTRNPQANAIVDRIHQTIGNMIRTFELYDNDGIDDDDPWSGILAAVMAAVRSTYSTTTHATPMQLVFGRDAVINTKFIADWDYIRQRKQNIIHQNNI